MRAAEGKIRVPRSANRVPLRLPQHSEEQLDPCAQRSNPRPTSLQLATLVASRAARSGGIMAADSNGHRGSRVPSRTVIGRVDRQNRSRGGDGAVGKTASKRPSIWRIAREALWEGGPGVCHFSITNACNARCAFCSFAHDRLPAESRRWVTLADAREACDILRRNGIRIVHFNGGEPTVHPDLTAMVAHAAQLGMMPALDTNGALLTERRIHALADAGLAKVCISIDAASSGVHDSNRGIPGLSA